MHGDRFRRPAVLQYGHTLTRATAVIGEERRSSNYWRPARAGCPPIDSRAVRCSLAPMALPLLWGPQGQRAGLGTRGLGVLYTVYGNKVKVGRYQSSRMPFGFFFFNLASFNSAGLPWGKVCTGYYPRRCLAMLGCGLDTSSVLVRQSDVLMAHLQPDVVDSRIIRTGNDALRWEPERLATHRPAFGAGRRRIGATWPDHGVTSPTPRRRVRRHR